MKLSILLLLTSFSLFAHPNWNCFMKPANIEGYSAKGVLSVGTNPNGGLYLRKGTSIILDSTQVMKAGDLELLEWDKVKNIPSERGSKSLYQAKLLFKQVRYGSDDYRESGVPAPQEINFWSEDVEKDVELVCSWEF